METLWLVKVGEITLKKGNRRYFERILMENIRRKFKAYNAHANVFHHGGRFYINTALNDDQSRRILQTTAGIVGFSKAFKVEKTLESLFEASLNVAEQYLQDKGPYRFKFEVRRTDKSLRLNSYEYAGQLGGMILEALPQLKVDVKTPELIIRIELREKGYVYGAQYAGPGGLPVSTTGWGMLMLSGGIDSPVAGWLMSKRGLRLTAVHFHTPPYTSAQSHDKVLRIADIIARWCGGLNLYSVPFTTCQKKISASVDPSTVTLHSRACMMKIAEILARKHGCQVLITGESLGQVASQTLESLSYTNGAVTMPVFRPLVGLDKEEIIALARKQETYTISIEPYDDCCSLFSPDRPLTRPKPIEQQEVFQSIEGLDDLMDKAVQETTLYRFDACGQQYSQADSLEDVHPGEPQEA